MPKDDKYTMARLKEDMLYLAGQIVMIRATVERLDERAQAEADGLAMLQAALSKPSLVQPANGELSYQDRLISAMGRERD